MGDSTGARDEQNCGARLPQAGQLQLQQQQQQQHTAAAAYHKHGKTKCDCLKRSCSNVGTRQVAFHIVDCGVSGPLLRDSSGTSLLHCIQSRDSQPNQTQLPTSLLLRVQGGCVE